MSLREFGGLCLCGMAGSVVVCGAAGFMHGMGWAVPVCEAGGEVNFYVCLFSCGCAAAALAGVVIGATARIARLYQREEE